MMNLIFLPLVVLAYPVAHVIVAGAIHIDVSPLLEAGGFDLRCFSFGGERHKTSTRLDCHVVLKVKEHF